MVQSKGNMIYHYREALKKTGEENYKKVMARLKPKTREFFESVIISAEDYDEDYHRELLKAIYDELGEHVLGIIANQVGKQQMTGFFGLVLKLITLDILAQRASKLWRRMYDEGSLEVIKTDKNMVVFTIHDFEFTDAHLVAFKNYLKPWIDSVCKKDSKPLHKRLGEKETEFTYLIPNE